VWGARVRVWSGFARRVTFSGAAMKERVQRYTKWFKFWHSSKSSKFTSLQPTASEFY
jgi:hypothetical protein